MQKVQITISGKQALVDADQVSKHLRKQALVKSAMAAQKNNDQPLLMEIMGKIIRLNRTIRQNVKFI